MATGVTKAISITGAGTQDTGFSIIYATALSISAAGTLRLREGASNGTIVAEFVAGAAGSWNESFGEGVRCKVTGTGTFFVENTAGNVAGGVSGNP